MTLKRSLRYKYRDGDPRLFYGCSAYPVCQSTHSAHPDGSPVGTPAKKDVRQLRHRVHVLLRRACYYANIDPRWEGVVLAHLVGRPANVPEWPAVIPYPIHVGDMDGDECRRVALAIMGASVVDLWDGLRA